SSRSSSVRLPSNCWSGARPAGPHPSDNHCVLRWRRYLAAIAALLIAVMGAGLAWEGRVEADKLVTNPIATRRLPTKTPIDFGLVYDDVAVTASDGARLVAWYVPTVNGAVVIAQHGYKSQRGEMLNEAEMLHRH